MTVKLKTERHKVAYSEVFWLIFAVVAVNFVRYVYLKSYRRWHKVNVASRIIGLITALGLSMSANFEVVFYMSPGVRKPTMWILAISDTNQAVQPLEMARGLEFWTLEF